MKAAGSSSMIQSSGAVRKSRWPPSWAPVPNKPTVSVAYGFCGRKATLNQFSDALGPWRPYGLLERSTSTFTQLMSSDEGYGVRVHCCFTSTETIRTVWHGEPRTATSTFTQLLSNK